MLKHNNLEMLARRLCPLVHIQKLSTAANPQTEEKRHSFRTTENSPLNHTANHIGQFYKLSPDIKKQLFAHGGFPKSFEIQTKTFTETCIMIRRPAVDIIHCLKGIDYEKPVVRFVLYGKRGNGKSLTLAHLIHYAYDAGFLIVHVPWVGNWMRRSKEFSNSESQEGYMDINLDAAAWLVHFKTQNAQFLSKPEFKCSQEYNWSKREKTVKDAPLSELIDHGINRIKYASDTIVALSNEIKTLSQNGVCKTFVAIDGYNAFFYPKTRIRNEKKEVVHPSKVTLTQGFLNLTNFNWKNAAVVTTVDEIAIAAEDQFSHMPKYLLTKEGFQHLDPFIPIEVTEYTNKELTSCMDYYRERKWVRSLPGLDEELGFLSANNPFKLMELTASL